jgi:hypothetical protein
MKSGLGYVVLIGYQVGALATFGKLTFLDDYPYTWWNWIVVVPINAFLSQIWPLYWGLIRPIFGS